MQALLSSLEEQDAAARQFELPNLRAGRRLVHGGAVLRSTRSTLCEYGVRDGSTVFEVHSLVGGGGDGGTTATQRKYLRHPSIKKATVMDESDKQRARWHHCAASGEPLREPLVACELGYIFNKEEVMKHLLAKTLHENFSHLRKLKDLFEIKMEHNPDYDDTTSNAKNEGGQSTPISLRPTDRCAFLLSPFSSAHSHPPSPPPLLPLPSPPITYKYIFM